jgi:hypothetical protein
MSCYDNFIREVNATSLITSHSFKKYGTKNDDDDDDDDSNKQNFTMVTLFYLLALHY